MMKIASLGLALLLLFALCTEANPVASESEQNVGTCHHSDYIRCAEVITLCTAECLGSYVCIANCVINKHHKECVDCIHHGLF